MVISGRCCEVCNQFIARHESHEQCLTIAEQLAHIRSRFNRLCSEVATEMTVLQRRIGATPASETSAATVERPTLGEPRDEAAKEGRSDD